MHGDDRHAGVTRGVRGTARRPAAPSGRGRRGTTARRRLRVRPSTRASWWAAATSAIDASATPSGPTSGTAWPWIEHAAVAAQLGRRSALPRSIASIDSGSGRTDDGDRRDDRDRRVSLAAKHEVAPVLGREAVDRLVLAARRLREAHTPSRRRLEEVGLHVDDDVDCGGDPGAVVSVTCRRGGRGRAVVVDGPWTVVDGLLRIGRRRLRHA